MPTGASKIFLSQEEEAEHHVPQIKPMADEFLEDDYDENLHENVNEEDNAVRYFFIFFLLFK